MRIQTSNLLPGSGNKNISINNNCLYATEGPNCVGKLDLSSLSINFDSFFSSNMTLQPQDKDMPIMYGFLGTNITFISIVVHYNSDNFVCDEDNYIEYYFEDQPLIRRTFTDILMLSGNDAHRIPQIYVYNPGEQVVNLEIMIANIDVNEITSILNPGYDVIEGLTYNSIITDQMFGQNCTGSTQYEILDPLSISGTSGDVQMVIPYGRIDIKEINDNVIIIRTTSDTPIKLVFLSRFNALQAFSRMEWVYEDTLNRYLTTTNLPPDIKSPIVSFNNPVISYPIDKSELKWRYIDSIVDDRDGEIDKSDTNLIIINKYSGEELEEIVEEGNYSLLFSISDLAGNVTTETKDLLMDSTPPEIHFYNYIATGSTDYTIMNYTNSNLISKSGITDYFIDYVSDNVDGLIDKSNVLVVINPNDISDISCCGDYELNFVVSDMSGNTNAEQKLLRVLDDVTNTPIIHFNSVFYGTNSSAFTMSLSSDTASATTGITEDDIRNYTISGVSVECGCDLSVDDVIITPIVNFVSGSTYDISFELSNYSNTETLNIIKNLKVIN